MNKEIEKLRSELRTAIADYMDSEGCGCCQGRDHVEISIMVVIILMAVRAGMFFMTQEIKTNLL